MKIKKLNENAIIPTRGSERAAGYDLYACTDGCVEIPPHCTVKIGTGLAMAVPEGYAGFIFARSGLATKRGLRPSNCVGLVDEDYIGEWVVALHNDTNEYQEIYNGDRIAQMVIMPIMNVDFDIVDNLDETERGTGGFGSTGK